MFYYFPHDVLLAFSQPWKETNINSVLRMKWNDWCWFCFITSAHSTDPLLCFWFHETLILSCKQCIPLLPVAFQYSLRRQFLCCSSFSSYCISRSMIVILLAARLSFPSSVVFFQVCSIILLIQLLSKAFENISFHIHYHSIDVNNLLICSEDSIIIRPEDSIFAQQANCDLCRVQRSTYGFPIL